MKKTRRKFSGTFKAKVAIEALKERESLAELSKRYEVHPNIIGKWKQEFLKRSSQVFDMKTMESDSEVDLDKLYSKIGKLEMENDFLKKSLKKIGL
jgi:transposase